MSESGITGVNWLSRSSKWLAQIALNKKRYHLGLYTNIEDAQKAREQAEAKIADGTFFEWHKNRKRPRQYEDLTGQKFNKLTALYRDHKNGKAYWVCKCDCGNETYVRAAALKGGLIRSCGCLLNIRDLTGERVGRLLVLERTEERSKGSIVWKCQCDCGKIVRVSAAALNNGNKKSCGCWDGSVRFVSGTYASVLKSKNLPKNNKSGIKGVSWGRKSGKWDANITFKKKRYSLGSYDDINDAAKARELAEEQLFRPFLEWHEAYIQSVLKGETPPKEPYIQLTKEYMSDRGRSS